MTFVFSFPLSVYVVINMELYIRNDPKKTIAKSEQLCQKVHVKCMEKCINQAKKGTCSTQN